MSKRCAKALGEHRTLNSTGCRAQACIEATLHCSGDEVSTKTHRNPINGSPHRSTSPLLPAFDHLPTLSDENLGDVLRYLLAMVDAFEQHYADPLRRLREKHYQEELDEVTEQQLDLPMAQHDEIEF